MTTQAVIASTARSPIGKAYRGSLNDTYGATLGAHSVTAALDRAGVRSDEVDDVVFGSSWNEGTTGGNIARQIALRAGLSAGVPGMTVNRYCSTGLQTVAIASQQVLTGQSKIVAAGGLESITLVENEHFNTFKAQDPWLEEHKPEIFMSMIETAEVVAERYGVDRETQDAYSLQSQQRTAKAHGRPREWRGEPRRGHPRGGRVQSAVHHDRGARRLGAGDRRRHHHRR
jgi:acetyl-CoA C-acetyltransferase